MRRWINRLIICIALLILLLIGSTGALILTETGLNVALAFLHKVLPSFSVESKQGTLFHGFSLGNVAYQSESFTFKGKHFSLVLDRPCLKRFSICFKTLHADGIDVFVAKSNDKEDDEKSLSVGKIISPIALFLNNITLNNVSLDIQGNKVAWDTLTTGIEFKGSRLTLKPTLWDNINITPATEQKNKTQPNLNINNKSNDLNNHKTIAKIKNKQVDNKIEEIKLTDIELPLDIIVEDFKINSLAISLDKKQIINQIVLKADAKNDLIELQTLAIDAEQAYVNAQGNIRLKGDYPLNLKMDSTLKIAPLTDHSLSLTTNGNLKELALDFNVKGKLQANLQAKLNLLDPLFPFSISMNSPKLVWPIDTPSLYQLTSPMIQAKGNLDSYDATLKTSLSGKDIPHALIQSSLTGNLSSVKLKKLNIKTLAGVIQGSIDANWQDDLTWKTNLEFEKIQPSMQWPSLEGDIFGQINSHGFVDANGHWQLDFPVIKIQGDFLQYPLSLKGQLVVLDDKGKGDIEVKTEKISIDHGPNHAELIGRIDEKIDIDLNLNISNLAASLPGAKGQLKGKVELYGDLKEPVASINLDGQALKWQKLISIDKFGIRGSVNSQLINNKPHIQGGLVANASNIKGSGINIKSVNFKLSGDEKKHILSLDIKGKPIAARLNLRGSYERDNWQGALYASNITTPIGPWRLEREANIKYNFKTKHGELGAFCWLQSPTRLCLDNSINLSQMGKAQLSLSQFKFSLLQSLLPPAMKLQGELDLNTHVAWRPDSLPDVNAIVRLSKGKVIPHSTHPFALGWDASQLSLLLADDKLTAKGNITFTDNGSVMVKSTMTGLATDERKINNQIKIKSIDLSMFNPFFKNEQTKADLQGMFNANLLISNNINKGEVLLPRANGDISISQLKIQSSSSPVEVTQGQIDIALNGTQGNLKGDINTPDGNMTLSGSAKWAQFSRWLASINVQGENIKLNVSPTVSLDVSPNVTLNASEKEINVVGDVSVPWGRILIESLPVSAVKVSNDVVLLNDKLQPIGQKKVSDIALNVKIGVKIGDDVKLEAFGLNTKLKGLLNVSNDQFGAIVNGEINLEEGIYRSFGQDLLIKKGYIVFNGPADQPYFQVEAIRNPNAIENGVEAGIRVTGSVDAPEVTIFSKPAMSQANALSYLLRGRNLDSESGSDSNVMTSLLINLGLSQSGNVVGLIGETFGVEGLSVDTSGTGDDEKVEVSGYILPELQVKYGVGIFTRLPVLTVRYRLLQDFYIEAVSGADNAVDFLYQFSIK